MVMQDLWTLALILVATGKRHRREMRVIFFSSNHVAFLQDRNNTSPVIVTLMLSVATYHGSFADSVLSSVK